MLGSGMLNRSQKKGMWERRVNKEKMGSLDLFTAAPGNETPLPFRLTMRIGNLLITRDWVARVYCMSLKE